jgi:hypothetical protein
MTLSEDIIIFDLIRRLNEGSGEPLISIKIDIKTKEIIYNMKRDKNGDDLVPLPINRDQRLLSFLMMISGSEVFTSQLRIGMCDSKEEEKAP